MLYLSMIAKLKKKSFKFFLNPLLSYNKTKGVFVPKVISLNFE